MKIFEIILNIKNLYASGWASKNKDFDEVWQLNMKRSENDNIMFTYFNAWT